LAADVIRKNVGTDFSTVSNAKTYFGFSDGGRITNSSFWKAEAHYVSYIGDRSCHFVGLWIFFAAHQQFPHPPADHLCCDLTCDAFGAW
jgi:hypothetical protein